jgi:hypothetical protein
MRDVMRRMLFGATVLLLAGSAYAHEGHDKQHATEKLTGEVVDITCYVDHGGKGEKHAACAQKCITNGMPVGIVAEGKLYAVILSSHESPNAKLAPYAGKLVTITGKRIEKDGMRIIDMDDVEPASAETKK